MFFFFFSSRRRHTRWTGDWSSDVCSSDLMVIRKEIAGKHPWVVLNLYKAFERANEIADRERLEHAEYHLAAGLLARETAEALRTALVRHGIRANRKVLETAALYSHEQGLTPRLVALDEVFAASAMEQ